MKTRRIAYATRCHVSARVRRAADLPPALRRPLTQLTSPAGSASLAAHLVVAFASELIGRSREALPEWAPGPRTRYLGIVDVPDPALLRLPSVLDIRRPEYRIHVTRDLGALRRLVIASVRGEARLGIVDAYLFGEALTVVTGDFELRSFPIARIPVLARLTRAERERFEIDVDGAYLHWPAGDVHLGVSQLLQAVDPMELADIEIARHSNDFTGPALRTIREARGLRQSDIAGLSERQVRRVEDGVSRLRGASAQRIAAAMGIPLSDLLAEIGRTASAFHRHA